MHIFSHRLLKQVLFAITDAAVTVLAWIISVWFYSYLFLSDIPLLNIILHYIPWLLLVNILVFLAFGMYKCIWRYAGIGSLLRLFFASVISNFVYYIIFRFVAGYWQSPSIPVMAFFVSFSLIGLIHFMPRITQYMSSYYNAKFKGIHSPDIPCLIVGAGQSTSILLQDIIRNYDTVRYNVLAIVDDDKNKHGLSLHGIDIVGGCELIPEIVDKFGIARIIISIPSATGKQLQRILSYCPTAKCKISIVSGVNILDDAKINNIKDINMADLLGRSETNLDISLINEMICKKTILITGGGGSIGSELCRQLLNFDIQRLIIFDFYENNAYDLLQEIRVILGEAAAKKVIVRIGSVQDADRLEEVFKEFKPSVVFHAAAYKHVPLMEECPRMAVQNNVFGTYNAASLSKKYHASKFIFISTDKSVRPTSIM
ncbi:MAG: polysaccharide biosynthesis protein, partial [Christensenella sp.]